MSKEGNFNKLQSEASAYLKQHANNPVHWYPYGPEALQLAKDENKPIFLSIGYSTCHWCHVMAHESFENELIARHLNDNFISIKVDKEEMPDLDSYFQLACQVMNGRGGWPLNAFLTPDMKPYYIGTYFPIVSAKDIPSFLEVLTNLSHAYKNDYETVKTNSAQIIDALKQPPTISEKVQFEGHYPAASAVLNALKNYQDDEFGGYGTGPKFPLFAFMEWSIEQMLEGMIPEEFGNHIIKTLENFLLGGVYDHARGGVHRYSTDEKWLVPHFEKMLYDQAGLLKLLSKASLIYPSPLVFDGLIQTLDYLKSEMLSEEGFFFSGQDSDSEGVEGLFFAFTRDEFLDSLAQFDESLAEHSGKYEKWFGITKVGNFEHNLNTITLNKEYKEEFYSPEGWNEVRKVRQALWEGRKMRMPPLTDSKGVASWNFQLVASLIDVVQYCKIDSIQSAAHELLNLTLDKVHKTFLSTNEEGKTRIKTSTTKADHHPLFEDYVMFIDMSFRCFEVTGHQNYYDNAMSTLDYIMVSFFKDGMFFSRALDFDENAEYANLHTPIFDQSYKSPLATLLLNLRKWSLVDPDLTEYLEAANDTMDTLTHLSLQNPLAFGETLRSLVYPIEAYRKLEIPRAWLKDQRFTNFFPNFSVRFAIHYHDEQNERWQICTHNTCEVQGNGVEEFSNVFSTPEKAPEKS